MERTTPDESYDPALDETFPTHIPQDHQFTENEEPHYPEGFPQPPHPPPLPAVAERPENVHKPRRRPAKQPHAFHLNNILSLPFLISDPPKWRREDDSDAEASSSYLPNFQLPFSSQITSGINSITSAFDRLFRRR